MLSHAGRLARALASIAGRVVRGSVRLVGLALVLVFYGVGAVAAAVVVAALSVTGAVRLGWSDTRKRAHGPA